MRGTIVFDNGVIACEKREMGAASLALQAPVGECGELTVQTCLLPEREEPYILTLELARHRLMTLYTKLEDWAMFDTGPDHPVTRRAELARRLFIEALCAQKDEPARADKLSRDCLAAALDGSEELAVAHAELLLNRRKQTQMVPRHPIGCGVALEQTNERMRAGLAANFDFVAVPTPWKSLTPEEGEYRLAQLDNWVEWASKNRMPVIAGPVVCFEPSTLPDWLFIWEHDYDTVRDVIYEHVERIVTRYRNAVMTWNVVSGLHVNSHFTFNFEQLMDLTRMATMLVKKVQPAARVMVEIRQPFGEYFAANPRSIPPMMYTDLLVQGAVAFDALSLKLLMGQAMPGQFTRDLMQISNLLDHFAVFGKPIHLTLAAPSEMVTQEMIAVPEGQEAVDPSSGFWRKPWSQQVQSHWLEALVHIALSKPFIESVAWNDLIDHPQMDLPLSGLISEDMQPKSSFRRMVMVRRAILPGTAGAGQAAAAAPPGTT
ncbi:MAG: endo-1,4-beta-xylanase [Planctomycetes bacterium]|nr:endo-1,4-beta-xylanase [Planctomycetota bacterium]